MKELWCITGDTHADFSRFKDYATDLNTHYNIIILGDAGVNYWLGKRDRLLKQSIVNDFPNITFYLVRGNHEARPESLKTGRRQYNNYIQGEVIVEDEYPNIYYLLDGETYWFNGLKALVIGGAYSVDKEYRQMMHWQWFSDEQLDVTEREEITKRCEGRSWDMVLSHTCPFTMQPRHLFLSMVDQSKVDNSMELWLDDLRTKIDYSHWWWAHYHGDWDYDDKHHMLFTNIIEFERK